MSEQSHIERLKKQGDKLAIANKKCKGRSREKIDKRTKHSSFTTCVKRELRKIFGEKK